MSQVELVNKLVQIICNSLNSARADSIDRIAMLLRISSYTVLRKYDFISLIAEKLRSHEAVLTAKLTHKVHEMQVDMGQEKWQT